MLNSSISYVLISDKRAKNQLVSNKQVILHYQYALSLIRLMHVVMNVSELNKIKDLTLIIIQSTLVS